MHYSNNLMLAALCVFSALGMSQPVTATEANDHEPLTLALLMQAMQCQDSACFAQRFAASDVCFKSQRVRGDGRFFRHERCHTDSPEPPVVVMFAVLPEQQFNASYSSNDAAFAQGLEHELSILGFERSEQEDVSDEAGRVMRRDWYASRQYPGRALMWEVLLRDGHKRWHIGVVTTTTN